VLSPCVERVDALVVATTSMARLSGRLQIDGVVSTETKPFQNVRPVTLGLEPPDAAEVPLWAQAPTTGSGSCCRKR